MRKLIALMSAALVMLPGVAHAADAPCLTTGEASAMMGYSLPSMITGITQRCGTNLGAGSFLMSNGQQLAARYAERKAATWHGAKAAFIKLSTTKNPDANKLLATMPDPTLQQMIDAVMEGMVSQQIPVDQCAQIDQVTRLLAPLPAENTAELVAVIIGLAAKSEKSKIGSIALCPAQ